MSISTKTSRFPFNTEPFVDSVLDHAKAQKLSGVEILLPYYRLATFMGRELIDVSSRALEDEDDLKRSFFEVFMLVSSLENGYICFYYVPRQMTDDFIISLIQVDIRFEIAEKDNYKWNELTEEWDITDSDADTDPRVSGLPANVYQAIVSSDLHHTGDSFDYTLVKEFMISKGYVITGNVNVDDKDILKEMTEVALENEGAVTSDKEETEVELDVEIINE